MANETEPRALGAALAAPAFVTRGHGLAMHAADRHVERWAPEKGAHRVRSMRALGFVDRLVAPWIETAQRSASLRLFSQYAHTGLGERQGGDVSWVFPRPWYQDELDWMAAARRVGPDTEASRPITPTLLTTRGTYVAPARAPAAAPPVVMPSALYEYVAPSLSLASSRPAPIPGVGFGGDTLPRGEAYSPLISLAAVQAAELMTRTVSPLASPRGPGAAPTAMTPALRGVLSAILARAAAPRAPIDLPPTRLSTMAPELVTPPAPRAADAPASLAPLGSLPGAAESSAAAESAIQVAEQYAAQRVRIAELQRIAQQAAQREIAARAEAARPTTPAAATAATPDLRAPEAGAPRAAAQVAQQAAATAELRAAAERAEAELRQRTAAGRTTEAADAAADAQRRAEAGTAADADRARAEAAAIDRARAEAASTGRASDAQRRADAADAAAAERLRIEERIAQRVAERTAGQRLHEQSRVEAAVHARAAAEPSRGPAGASATAPVVAPRAPAEVAAAIAALPPELAAMLAPMVAQRPERAMQAIHELNDTLRTVELLARSSASGAVFEVTRGPRLVMPAGMGGLVSAVDRAQSISERPAVLGGQRPLAPLAQLVAPPQDPTVRGAAAAGREARVPALSWLSADPRSQSIAPTTALGATATSSPAALSHVAWADRWLARFAGAAPQSLDVITAAGAASPAIRMQALADAAPGAVFVAPDFLRGDLAADDAARSRAAAMPAVLPATPAPPMSGAARLAEAAPSPVLINPPAEAIRRYDDEGETPDDVFAAISAAASRGRTAPRPAAATWATPSAAQPAAPAALAASTADRPVLADLVAHAAPSAPGAGLSAQLASSPFAPALRHVLSLPSAVSFDVRSLFGAGLGATYLAGLIGQASHELEIGTQSMPTWAAWSEAPLATSFADRQDRIDRMVPGFDAAYVTPEAARDQRDPGAASLPGQVMDIGTPSAAMPSAAMPSAAMPSAATPSAAGQVPALAEHAAALTTLRTALLSWDVSTAGQPGAQPSFASPDALAPAISYPGSYAVSSPVSASASYSGGYPGAMPSGAARRMVEAMSLPMLGDAAPDPSSAWAAPGMVAERAHSWSVAQERSASDLALDFVTPELVLAARVYGLGPADAAQAARLAIVGPGQLGAMASTVDRTFVEAMAIGREARLETERQHRIAAVTHAARVAGEISGAAPSAPFAAAPAPSAALPGETRAAITTAFPTADGAIAAAITPAGYAPPPRGAAFGVDRRPPRGAFLWPSATIAALGMTAAAPDGQLSMSVAALELLAAQVVAEIGTYTALSDADAALGLAGEAGSASARTESGAPGAEPDRSPSARSAALAAASPAALVAGRAGAGAPGAVPAEPAEAEVLGAAAAFVPASRRARFEALYVALSQSTNGLHWSPAARAARALALAGRGEDAAMSARERAATAWDVLPVVYASDSGESAAQAGGSAPASAATAQAASAAIAQAMTSHVAPSWLGGPRASGPAGARAGAGASGRGSRSRAGGRDVVAGFEGSPVDMGHVAGPGLSALSARAGEALGSYVTPVSAPSAPAEPRDTGSVGAVMRPPSAAPEYVQTARSGGRHGGGEVEIPPWFEAAARKMLAERSDSGGISLAELTLVTAAPATHVAASTRSAPSASPPAPSTAAATNQSNAPQIDVEKLANEVYRNILVLMDIARARNGDPYL